MQNNYIAIDFDEMCIFVYNKHTHALVGFVILVNVNSHLLAFENHLKSNTSSTPSYNLQPLAATCKHSARLYGLRVVLV